MNTSSNTYIVNLVKMIDRLKVKMKLNNILNLEKVY